MGWCNRVHRNVLISSGVEGVGRIVWRYNGQRKTYAIEEVQTRNMNIVLSPDPTLRQVAQECEVGSKDLKRLSKQMIKAMYKNKGVGLAAPQVGVLKRLVVVDCDEEYGESALVLVNPVIVNLEGYPVTEDEGCLSCPGISVPITRKPFAQVSYYDLDGNSMMVESDGLLGRCLQHEIDHLNGITLFESCDPIARINALRDYDMALAAGAKPGDVSSETRVR